MNWIEKYFRNRWFRKLLKEGRKVGYFDSKTVIDWECEWIDFHPSGVHMDFEVWERARINGLSPKEAIQEDLSYS